MFGCGDFILLEVRRHVYFLLCYLLQNILYVFYASQKVNYNRNKNSNKIETVAIFTATVSILFCFRRQILYEYNLSKHTFLPCRFKIILQ